MKNFETSLTNFLLILILIFIGVGINLLTNINRTLGYIYVDIDKTASNTYATLMEIERDKTDKVWTKEEYKKVDAYYDNLWKIMTSGK